MPNPPKTLGKYRLLEPVGRGGMGEVYRAFQQDLNRHVAIKMLLAGEHATEEFLQRFQREARMAAKLTHPNIVQIHDIAREGRLHYIVMEFVEGRSLKELMAERKLDAEQALKIAHSVARTLQYAHDEKIVHRDIKPANLLVDRQGRVRILDFGLAKSLSDGKSLSGTSVMVGTPYYMSPEQAFAAPEEVDHRTDLYSLGAVLYEMLTGRPPFEGGTVLALLRKIEDEVPAPPGVSPAIDAAVMKALAKDRERRFQSANEMADALKACLSRPAATRVVRPDARRIPWPALAAAGAAFGVLVLAWAAWPSTPGEASAPESAAAAPDPAAELQALLERKNEVSSDELARFRDDARLRRLIARHYQKRGQFSRALDDLKGYERAVGELASARALQRFVSPALFKLSIPQPRDLKGAEALLISALARHQEGKQEAARLKLKAAQNNGAHLSHVLLVRAHVDLWDVWNDPGGEAQKPVLDALRRELEKTEELFLLPLKALADFLAGDADGARKTCDRLSRLSPGAAEPYVLSAILFQKSGRIDLAVEDLEVAQRMDGRNFDGSIHRLYLRWLEMLNEPSNETVDAEEMREILDDRLRHDHYPVGLFLRALLHALDSRWEAAEDDLRKMARRAPLDRVVLDHELLAPFLWGGESRTKLLDAAANLQEHLGRREAALATSELVTGEEFPEEERKVLLRDNHRRIARLIRDDEARALTHLEEALKLGAAPQELREDPSLMALREKPGFEELLKRHEQR